ncbi:MAG: leucine-rich repeat domain-containing protein, partial [Anaeroplasmataceae bacterium]|nr:leucine-rich repeat domain-containing protein [Anaeroplasmataceae bacterium]
MKKIWKGLILGKTKILSIVFAAVSVVCLTATLALNMTMKPREDTPGGTVVKTEADYQSMGAIDEGYLLFKSCTAADAPDHTTAGLWCIGIDLPAIAAAHSNAWDTYLRNHPALVIPSKVGSDDVVGIDFSGIGYNNPIVSGSHNSGNSFLTAAALIEKVVIPKSVKYITEYSFNSFSKLGYFETPFIGTSRGSSARGINMTLIEVSQWEVLHPNQPTSDSFATMFGKPIPLNRSCILSPRLNQGYPDYWYTDNSEGIDYSPRQIKWREIDDNQNNSTYFYFNAPDKIDYLKITDETALGNYAMVGCSARHVEITAQGSVFSFGSYTFAESGNLGDALTGQEPSQGLESIELRMSGSISMRVGTFNKCETLKSLILPYVSSSFEIPEGFISSAVNLEQIYIPSTVRSIGNGAFKGCEKLARIAVYSCNGNYLTVDKKLKFTGDFEEDSKLILTVDGVQINKNTVTKFDLPTALETIGVDAFAGCKSFDVIYVPNNVTSIGYGAYDGCTSVKKATLPFVGAHAGRCTSNCTDDIKNSGSSGGKKEQHGLFGWIFGDSSGSTNCYSATQAYVNKDGQLTTKSFFIPSLLTELTIEKETYLYRGAFQGLKSLVSISVNPAVGGNIEIGCFDQCANLVSLTISSIPGNLGALFAGNGSFIEATSTRISNYRVPNTLRNVKVTNMPTAAGALFHNCYTIETVEFSNATTEFGNAIFYNTSNLTSLIVPIVGQLQGKNPYTIYMWWRDVDYRNSLMWLFSFGEQTDHYRNTSQKYYESYAPYIPSKLVSLTVTNESELDYYSLRGFYSLKNISITNIPGNIAEGSFGGCTGLTSLQLPYIGQNINERGYAGRNHVLGWIFGRGNYGNSYAAYQYDTTYYIPNGLEIVEIGTDDRSPSDLSNEIFEHAFKDCKSITTIDFNQARIIGLGSYAFANCTKLEDLHYDNAAYTHVGNYAFYNCKTVKRMKKVGTSEQQKWFIPSTVRTIGNYAFAGTSVGYLDNDVYADNRLDLTSYTSVGAYAFANCLQIDKVVIPENLSFGAGLFANCSYLEEVTLPTHNKVVTPYMFQNCISLPGVDISGISSIPEGLFYGCSRLSQETGLILNQTVNTYGPYCFAKCSSLGHFEFPATEQNVPLRIETGAFQGCTGMDYMTIPQETLVINPYGWIGCDDNFFFYVYDFEEDWPNTWVNNWNCDYPVYVLSDAREDIFTYYYSLTEKKYYITGITKSAYDLGLFDTISIPATHNGLAVVGIDESMMTTEDRAAGAQSITTQAGITRIILPKGVTKIVGEPFKTGQRVDIYTNYTKAEIAKIYADSKAAIDKELNDWAQSQTPKIPEDSLEYANKKTELYQKIKGWVPFGADGDGNCIADGTGLDARNWTSGGILYYKDYWQYAAGTTSPCLNIDTFKYTFDEYALETASYDQGNPVIVPVVKIQLPGEIFVNPSLGVTVDELLYLYDVDILNYKYTNNVNVGTANVTVTVNNDSLDYYNKYINSFGEDYPLKLTGSTTLHFQVLPIEIYLSASANEGLYYTKEYDRNKFTFNQWQTGQMTGLESYPTAVFSGTIATNAADAGFYFAEDMYWSTPWRVTINGVDVTKNFRLTIGFWVEIEKMEVEVVWAKSSQPVNGVYQLAELSGEKKNGKDIYLYPYIGGEITPSAIAKRYGTESDYVPYCQVNVYHISNPGIYTYEKVRDTYHVYARLADEANFILYENVDGEKVVPEVILGATQRVVAVEGWYRVSKGRIVITIDLSGDNAYLISPYENEWSKSWGSEPKGDGTHRPINDRTYITGLGANSRFVGKLATSSDVKSTYNYHSLEDGIRFKAEASPSSYVISWQDISFNYSWDTDQPHSITFTAKEEMPFLVWNPVLGEENENDCYDVVVDARVKINYNEFVPTFFIGLNSGDYPTIKNPTYINRDYTLLPRDVQDENGNIVGTRTYYYWEYAVDGKEYRFSAEDLDVLAKKYPGYQVTYHKGNGTELISEDPTFTQLGDHVFSVTLSARHYDEIQYDIWIKAVRSNVQIGELSKYYDREPVDILDKIIKIGEDQVPNITYIYMDQYGTELHQPPVDAGKYKVRIIVPQGEFFNAFDQVISYEIYPRNITIDVSKPLPGKDFDNLVYTLDLSTLTDLGATSVPGEGLLSGDRLQGIIQTSDFVPAKYYANSSAAYHFVWAADWNVTYLGDYTDVSRNYRVNLVGEYEIRPLQFQYNVRDNLGTLITERDESDHLYKDYIYDSAYHSIKVNVTYPTPTNYYPAPTPKYEVYYSDSPLSEYSSAWSVSCPPCIAPGQHKIYYMIKADYFKTIIDYVVIDIKELPIVYDDPAWNDGDGDDARYTIEYNGSNQTYEIEVIDPKYSATVYYSVNGGRETLEAPMFKEVGEYTVHYRITAPNYEEVNVTVIVHVTEPGEELPTTAFEYNFFSGVYDGNPHSVSGRFLPSFINSQTEGFWYEVTYSVDDGQNWTTVAPSYTEIGKYPVKIKFRSRGYQTLIIPGQIQITGKPMYLETVPVTVVFDGQYHNIGLTTNQSGCSVALDTTTNKFMYTDATGTVELTILYSLDANVAASDSGWIDGPGYKNVGQYPVYAKIVAENYEPVIFTTYTPLEIQFLENPFADMEDQKFEYSKSPIETSQIEIDTVADGVRTAYWYTAHYAPGNIPTQDIPEERISAPQELGLYYVVIKIAPTRNTGAAEVSGFIEIIPRTIHVEWETPQYYDGNIKEPHAKAETGTSDSVSLMYEVIGGVSPIEVGTYDFNVWMATPNPNYVLDTNIITLEILKRSVLFSFKEEMEVKDGYVKWNHTDSVYYDNSEQCPGDDHWHLLGDLQGTAEKYQGTELVEITYSGLSPNHMFYAELETSSGLRGQYFYSTVKNDYYINSVKVLKWDIYEKDENNRIKTIGGVPVSAKDYYDVDFDIVVSIINPRIDLSSLEIITDYVYDGLPHTIYINVPAAKYSGAYVYYKDDSGRYSTVPPRRTFVGEYPVDYYVSAPGFEDTYGSATLKITPADLQIAISDLHKKADPTKTLHEKYDATPHINSYELTNISGPVPDATHMKYYDATEFKEEEIIALYQNFDANSAIYKSGINELVDAGKYYCVVYYEEDINRWHESFAMMYVELKPRDILIEFPIGSIADIRRTYNGDPVVIPLANAIIDTDMHGDDGLLDIHTLNTTPQVQKQYFVQTNSANAGVYPLDTGFEFAAIDIREKVGMKKVKMSNYHPYLIGDFYVEILKKYLEDFEFELLLDEYSKIYDGYVHTPEYFAKDVYTCVSDGELNMTFFEILEDDTEVLCSGNQKNAGKYRVVLGIEEGTNYYSSYDSHAALKSDNTPFLSYATVEYRVNCAQKLVDVIWKDLVQTFNGEVLAPKPIFIDAETDHTQEIEAQLKTIYYDNESRQFIPMNIVNAGSYMVAAVFDESTFVGRTYAKNYILNTRTNMDTFFVNKLTLAIQLGDGGSTNNIIYYSSQAPWSTKLYTKPTPGAAEFVSLGNAEIQKWIDNMTISLGSDDYQDAMVSTIGFEETVYTDSADFVVDIKILNRFGVDVTSSIDFDIIGTVRIVADEIVYELTDTVTVTYRESKDQSGATGYTLAELNCLKVLNPRQYEIAHYKINGELKNVNDRISQAGEYELEFDITATDKIPVHCVVHVTIEKHSAYMIFTGSLNKTYDGATVNISNLINYNLSGFNGNMSDLEFRYVEIDPNAGEIPLTEAPKDAGQYKVYVTSRADSDPNVHKNYTTLEVEQLFKISPKTINLSYDRDLELENDDLLGQPWEDKRSALAGDVVDVVTGDRLVYSISVDPLARGNYYAKKTFTQSNGGAYQDFTSDNHTPFNFSWYVNATDDAGNDRLETIWDGTQYVDIPIDNSKNYTVNLTFKLLVHYPYIPVEFTGVEVEYDGNSYHGTVTFSNDKAGRHDAGWYLDNVIQNYSENAIGIESSSIHTIDDPNITYTEPGEHVVYYYLAVNPAATDMKYEEARGSFIINIKKLTRQITVTPPNKQYDKDPAGHIVTGTTTQRWFPEYEITRDTSIPDVYDMDDVTMSYFSGTTPIDASVGCIEAGTYYFSMEFPETDYYYATVVPRTRFVIDRIKIFIKDASELGGESFVYDNLVKTYDINYNKATQTQYDHDSYSIYVLNEDGDPESIELAGLLLRATLITRNKEVGTYFGSDGSLTLFAYEFEVYDVNDDQDATNNYVVDYAQATVEIQNDEMRWTANSPEYIYDGELHGFSVSFGSPHKSQVTIEYYNEQTGQWQVTPIEYRNVGVHTVDVRFKAKNYNDVTTTLSMEIKRAPTIFNYVSYMGKIYDGAEVTIPTNIQTNRETANEENMRLTYTYEYYVYDSMDSDHAVIKYTQWFTGYDAHGKAQYAFEGTRPIDVGKYMIRITIPEAQNYEEGVYESIFYISKRDAIVNWAGSEFEYDGTPKSPAAYMILTDEDIKNKVVIK